MVKKLNKTFLWPLEPDFGHPCTQKNKKQNTDKRKSSYPSHYFAFFVHADVVITLFSFYSNVAPECFRLHHQESCMDKERNCCQFNPQTN